MRSFKRKDEQGAGQKNKRFHAISLDVEGKDSCKYLE